VTAGEKSGTAGEKKKGGSVLPPILLVERHSLPDSDAEKRNELKKRGGLYLV